MDSLYLIDVSALAYRSFYAFINQPLTKSDGTQTSAIFGFASHVLRLIAERKPTHIAFVKDLPKPTFRHALYADYKAHRKPMPDPLREQLPVIDDFVGRSGLRTVALEGYEADDVIATLAVQAQSLGMEAYIVTRDKDMMQLVGDGVHLFELGKIGTPSVVMGPDWVKEKMGVGPNLIVDYLALLGDASDNVPGVGGIGPKGAVDLLETYGSVERIYANVGNITKKALRANLEKDRENAFLSKKLVTLDTRLALPVSMDDLRYPGLDGPSLTEFLTHWELKSLLKLVPAGRPGDAPTPAAQAAPARSMNYRLVDSPEALAQLAARLAASSIIAIDTETAEGDPLTAALIGLSIAVEANTGWYLPIGHAAGPNLSPAEIAGALKPAFDDPAKLLVFHDAKRQLPALARNGLDPAGIGRPGKLADIMAAAHLANPGERKLTLADLAERHFGEAIAPIETLIGKTGRGSLVPHRAFAQVPAAEACRYGAGNADYVFRLWDVLAKDLAEKELTRLFYDEEMALLPVLMAMEGRGIALDVQGMKTLAGQLAAEIARLETEIHGLAGGPFNIASPIQLQEILFEKLGLKAGKKTKTGYSTDADVLAKLEGEHPIISLLLDHRECTKLMSTYVEALPQLVHPITHRVHTTYSQVIAATGRLSSINPNLQNIPIRTELGRVIRRCFTPGSEGKVLLCADYSQIELRLLAHISGDPTLREAYRLGLDIHARTAAALYKVPESQVTAEMRRNAKVVNFGVLYGMGAHRLAAQLKIPRLEAARFIDNYFATYADVDRYIRETVDKGRKLGYVETLTGRRRYIPDLLSDNRMLMENAERIAANTPIQGSAADLIKIAMIRIHDRLAGSGLDCAMLLQVHDELVFEVGIPDIAEASRLIKGEMEGAMTLEVPLVVETGYGPNWMDAHP